MTYHLSQNKCQSLLLSIQVLHEVHAPFSLIYLFSPELHWPPHGFLNMPVNTHLKVFVLEFPRSGVLFPQILYGLPFLSNSPFSVRPFLVMLSKNVNPQFTLSYLSSLFFSVLLALK